MGSLYENYKKNVKGGIVLVFDLDGTIAKYIDLDKNYNSINDIKINPAILKILAKAVEVKKLGHVDAILLLTNNSSDEYIKAVELVIRSHIDFFKFDDIMNRIDPRRIDKLSDNPAKYLEDVETMLKGLGLGTENLKERVYFFDDLEHEIRNQIPSEHYIKITPEYDPKKLDNTDYMPIFQALKVMGGGLRSRGSSRRGRSSRKNSMRKRITKRRVAKK
jgi:hypothetical protein